MTDLHYIPNSEEILIWMIGGIVKERDYSFHRNKMPLVFLTLQCTFIFIHRTRMHLYGVYLYIMCMLPLTLNDLQVSHCDTAHVLPLDDKVIEHNIICYV
jgi:hypothetical protein